MAWLANAQHRRFLSYGHRTPYICTNASWLNHIDSLCILSFLANIKYFLAYSQGGQNGFSEAMPLSGTALLREKNEYISFSLFLSLLLSLLEILNFLVITSLLPQSLLSSFCCYKFCTCDYTLSHRLISPFITFSERYGLKMNCRESQLSDSKNHKQLKFLETYEENNHIQQIKNKARRAGW